MTIAAILEGKGRDVIQVRSTDSVLSVVTLLAEQRIGCVPVVDDGQVVGIFSERDLVYRVATEGAAALSVGLAGGFGKGNAAVATSPPPYSFTPTRPIVLSVVTPT